ncbi:hypothetical protein CCO03_08875 [Comamonas serinivorans]|uniref:DUF2938 domain-containing protein n=1 Tax=Comamonas serinivorans TaxID=1082851 RepID=A0A1Y0EMF0_9BURK|nr:hypothetical protein [Comamonas serinivorans]ARU04776.1 hypothetical protein CCO03_08875 [Comamonas serinivorans]
MTAPQPQTPCTRVLREALLAGTLASVLSAAALVWAGHREVRSTAAPLNAVGHWRWGNAAFRQYGFTGRHTALGYAIHHGASIWWSGIHAFAMTNNRCASHTVTIAGGSLATSAVAWVVDFNCIPKRLTPGFEHHLSRSALVGVYLLFAAGLALGAARSRRSTR